MYGREITIADRGWSSDEARRFLESAKDDEDPFYAAHVLVLVLGLRRGEVLGLVWDDIDLEAAELSVGLQLQRIRRRLLHRSTKTETSDAALPPPATASATGGIASPSKTPGACSRIACSSAAAGGSERR